MDTASHITQQEWEALCACAGVRPRPAWHALDTEGPLFAFDNHYGSTCNLWESELRNAADAVALIRNRCEESDAKFRPTITELSYKEKA